VGRSAVPSGRHAGRTAGRLTGRFPDVAVRRKIEIGDPASPLIEASKRSLLAVVGSHGRGGFAGMMLVGRGGGGQPRPDPGDRGAAALGGEGYEARAVAGAAIDCGSQEQQSGPTASGKGLDDSGIPGFLAIPPTVAKARR
jgi:hypothetical protein